MGTIDAVKGVQKTQGLKVVNIHEAKTHLSRLVEEAFNGESFIIAKSGKPMVQVTRVGEPEPKDVMGRLGFLKGLFEVPIDIKTPFKDEIEEMFYGKE